MTTATVSRASAVRIGPEGLPARTLGWEVLGWTAEYLLQPDGPRAGEPWRFTDEQARSVLWWYAIDAEGRFVYRSGVLRRMKGWGKDPVGAALCCVEFVGPCRFAGWREDGEPAAVPHEAAWVQTAAVARDQTRNTMTLFPAMLSARAIEEYGIDLGKEIIYAHQGRCRIEAVTSSPRALEGGRATFVLKNETQHWLRNNEGHAMAEVIARNAAKSRDGSARVLAITNAHRLGEDSDAEHDWEAWRAIERGEAAPELLYDSLEAPADTDLADEESLRAGLEAARGDSVWVPVERLVGEVRDPRADANQSRRFYLNQIRADRDGWISQAEWQHCEEQRETPAAAEAITLGFDGSRFRDATALVATHIESGYQWVLGLWQRGETDGEEWEVPAAEVSAVVAEALERWEVWRLYADPYWWEETIARWAGRYGEQRVVVWPTAGRVATVAKAIKAFETAVRTSELTHEPSVVLAQHVANAVKRPTGIRDEDGERLYTIAKEHRGSARKIDAAMAAILSWEARTDAVAAGVLDEINRPRWVLR